MSKSPDQLPSTVLTEKFTAAVAYAAQQHASHVRKGTAITYLCHPLGVASLVLEAGGSEDEAIAGLLHDVAEDCGGEPRLIEIKDQFGPDVERIVRACSDTLVEDRADKAPWRQRKEEHLLHLLASESDVALVTAADKLHNARAVLTDLHCDGPATLERFNAPSAQDLAWYYMAMLQVLTWKRVPRKLQLPLADAVFGIVATALADPDTRAIPESAWAEVALPPSWFHENGAISVATHP